MKFYISWNLTKTLQVVLDNGIVRVTLSNPQGIVTGIAYNGIDNLLEVRNVEDNRGLALISFVQSV